MPRRQRILIVAQTTRLSSLLINWLNTSPHELAVVSEFASARIHLDMEPDLLITELRLRDHNGLHLALRARTKSVPAIVIGDPDPVLERDAFELGATYLHVPGLQRDDLLEHVHRLIASSAGVPRRNHIAWLDDSATYVEAEQRPPAADTPAVNPPGSRPVMH